jgi:hypothetical protein
LLSSHLETGHYFNPHAQRIIEGQTNGATLIVIDPRLSNTSAKADVWLPAYSGTEGALLLAMVKVLLDEELYDREFVRTWVDWRGYLRAARPELPVTFDHFIGALKELYAPFTPAFAAEETGVDAARIVEAARAVGRARAHLQHAQLAVGRRRQFVGLADHALPLSAGRAHGIGRHQGRRRPSPLEQVRPEASDDAAAAGLLERAAVSARIPVGLFRDELPAAAFPQGKPRQTRRLLHPRLQPGVDEPRRFLLDGDAHRSRQDRIARRVDTHVERDRLVCRLHPADGPGHGTPRHDEPGKRTPRSGWGSVSRCCASRARSAASDQRHL